METHGRTTSATRVVVVSQDPSDAALVQATLDLGAEQRFDVQACAYISDVSRLRQQRGFLTALVRLDPERKDHDGDQALLELRASVPDVPVVALLPSSSAQAAQRALRSGAHEMIPVEQVNFRALERKLRFAAERSAAERQLSGRAYRDSATGLMRRSAFVDRLQQAISRAERRKQSCAVVVVEFPELDQALDELGRNPTLDILRSQAELLLQTLRDVDSVGRIRDDCFAILLEDLEAAVDASGAATRVRRSLRTMAGSDHRKVLTTRLGLTSFPGMHTDAEGMLSAALRAASSDDIQTQLDHEQRS